MKRTLSVSLLGICLVVGFSLAFGSSRAADKTAATVTYSKDVAPLIQKNCQVCHRPGEVAPMSFMSYKEVRPWARSIKEKVVSREMPPWFADAKHAGEFSNDCSLTQKEIETFTAWVDGGAKEGDPKETPANPKYTEGWQIGKPDVVLTMTEDFNIPVEGAIPYKYFAVPTNFIEDKYVQFAEIRSGDRAHVHHVIITVRYPGSGPLPAAGEISPNSRNAVGERADGPPQQQQNGERPAAGPPAQRQRNGENGERAGGPPRQRSIEDSDGRLIGWAPSEAPLILRPGQAKLIKKGSVLVFQVHYVTNGEVGKDRTSVGLIFSKEPVEKRVITASAGAFQLVIPPYEPNYESSGSFTFKEDSHIDSLHPHMHVRGKDFRYTLVYPDGTKKELLWVPRYDFGWQLTYVFKEEVAAPKGSRLEVVAHHDNSIKNKFNPDPSATVRFGDQTWDEMMIGYFDYTIDKQDLRKKELPAAAGRGRQ